MVAPARADRIDQSGMGFWIDRRFLAAGKEVERRCNKEQGQGPEARESGQAEIPPADLDRLVEQRGALHGRGICAHGSDSA